MSLHLYLLGLGVCLVLLAGLVEAGLFDRYIE